MLPIERYPSARTDSTKQTRHLLTLLKETEKEIQHDPDIASAKFEPGDCLAGSWKPRRIFATQNQWRLGTVCRSEELQ
jgi:hypothetical protein